MDARITPVRLHLKKDEKLEVDWQDGHHCTFLLTYLRSRCPCAACKTLREEQAKSKSRLTILPGNYSGALTARAAQRVGNYAIRIDWSDNHGTGIYSFEYLREICPCGAADATARRD